MKSNKELREEIESLAKQVGIEQPDTERLGNPALTSLAQKLRDDLAQQAASGSTSASGATGASGGATGATGATASGATPASPPPVNGDVTADNAGQPPERLLPGTPLPYVPRFPFEVAPGKSLSTLTGILVAGQEITARDVGSEKQLEHLVEHGYVLKGPAKKG